MRLFIGIPIPSEYAETIRAIQNNWKSRLASRIGWVKPERMHVTLRFLGDVDASKIPLIHAAMQRAFGDAFALQGEGGDIFYKKGAPQTVWLGFRHGADACVNCGQVLDQELIRAGFPGETRPFVPHLTIARVKSAVRDDDWNGLLQDLDQDWPVFSVQRIVLWQSILHANGPEYKIVAATPE